MDRYYHESRQPRVGGIILDRNNRLLIVKGKASGKWSLPKGGLEPNENYIVGALREIREETGLKLKVLRNYNDVPFWKVSKGIIFLFNLDMDGPKLTPKDTKEIEKAIWLDLTNKKELYKVINNSNKMLIAAVNRIRRIMYV